MLRPSEHIFEFLPIRNVGKLHGLDGRARNHQPVELRARGLYLVERVIERAQMLDRRILRVVSLGTQKNDIRLQRRIGYKPQQLRFGIDLIRHEVEYSELERTDILQRGAVVGHDEHVFALERGICRQSARDVYGHYCTSLTRCMSIARSSPLTL